MELAKRMALRFVNESCEVLREGGSDEARARLGWVPWSAACAESVRPGWTAVGGVVAVAVEGEWFDVDFVRRKGGLICMFGLHSEQPISKNI